MPYLCFIYFLRFFVIIFPRVFHSEPVLFDFPAALSLFALLIVYVVLGLCYYLGIHVLK
jgi:hypothetical protein